MREEGEGRRRGRERKKDGCKVGMDTIAAALPKMTIFINVEQPCH